MTRGKSVNRVLTLFRVQMSFTARKFSRKIPWDQQAPTGCVTGLDQRQNSVIFRTVQQGCRELGGQGSLRCRQVQETRWERGVRVRVCGRGVFLH